MDNDIATGDVAMGDTLYMQFLHSIAN
jgi:hypothetical protein